MLGIVKNRHIEWGGTFRLLPIDFLEVFSLGYLTLRRFKIVKSTCPWLLSLRFLGVDVVIVLSFGYLTAIWAEE